VPALPWLAHDVEGAAVSRVWKCPGCGTPNPRVKQKCVTCARSRPKARRPRHGQVLLETPHEAWEARFGSHCNICGRPPSAKRRLDRDHDHSTGLPRGVLCFACNRVLSRRVTVAWLHKAIAYLERAEELAHNGRRLNQGTYEEAPPEPAGGPEGASPEGGSANDEV
jgi:hypothetical protein